MTVRFWGTRGSIPAPGPATVRYGGNTPCVELRTALGELLILDAGTGARELGRALVAAACGSPVEGDFFLTHAHWDHIQGLPFFEPLFRSGNSFRIWGAPSLEQTVDRGVRDQMARGAFPVAFDDVGAAVEFRLLDGEPHRGAGYEVDVIAVRHPGGALGYRFRGRNAQAGGLVYISDNELGSYPGYDSRPGWRGDLVGFIRGSRLLVHDAMYTVEEYAAHRGWGHSSDRDVVELALEAGVETLVLFHHKPERTDDEMDGRVDACRKVVAERGSALKVLAAAEGLTLTV
ncbi:MAG: MBL fold metallo-hydrolase [Gemmatimonadota bacterium]|nr:MBL fold metallo-hydrolase [Gemmatimonadota bacterium]